MREQHPIQIKSVDFIKLYIEKNSRLETNSVPETGDFQLQSAHSNFDEESKEIWVKVSCKIGYDKNEQLIEDAEFWLDTSLEACFSVDTEKFNPDNLPHWAHNNATIVLYPYIREAVASLTGRAFTKDQAMLPLLTLPMR
ncbi:hypothetical protein [Vibrio fortis]|uniref:hypothetical protein n=1 Tax=Vibrio fortis TaxID=212667 RepID=UPI003EBAB9BF